jgi:hypothetical protein
MAELKKTVKLKDIELTTSGYYRLPCDGRHDYLYHFYMYYSKREVLEMWRAEHPNDKNV